MKQITFFIPFLLFSNLTWAQNQSCAIEKAFNGDTSDIKGCLLSDLKNGKLYLFTDKGMAPKKVTQTLAKNDKAFTKKYDVSFYHFGCVAPPNFEGLKEYSKLVFNYLNDTFGTDWQEEIRQDVLWLVDWKSVDNLSNTKWGLYSIFTPKTPKIALNIVQDTTKDWHTSYVKGILQSHNASVANSEGNQFQMFKTGGDWNFKTNEFEINRNGNEHFDKTSGMVSPGFASYRFQSDWTIKGHKLTFSNIKETMQTPHTSFKDYDITIKYCDDKALILEKEDKTLLLLKKIE